MNIKSTPTQPPSSLPIACHAWFHRYIYIAILLCLCTSEKLIAQLPEASFRGLPISHNFTTEDYQAGIQNWGISQDQYGLLHVANNFGLLSFDGEEWQTTSIPSTTRLRAVHVDEHQRIYIGGQGNFGYLEARGDGTSQFHSLKHLIPQKYLNFDEIWRIYELEGSIYFCSFQYIFKYREQKIEVLNPNATIGFSFLLKNKIYVSHRQHGIAYIQNNRFVPLPQSSIFKDMDIRGIEPHEKDVLLIATQNKGFYLYDKGQVTPWNPLLASDLEYAQINCIKRLRNHHLAIGTQNQGLFILDHAGQLVYALNKNRGLANQTILSLHQDQLGNLWAGLNNGIAYIELEQPFTLIGDELGLPGTGYTAEKFKDKIYLGTSTGLFYLEKRDPISAISTQNYQPVQRTEGQTYSLQAIGDELFLGHHNGEFLVEGTQATILTPSSMGMWRVLPVIPNKKMLAGSYDGMYLLEKKDGQWRTVKKYQGFQESSRKFEKGINGDIWMSHGYKGVYRLSFSPNYDSLLSVRHYDSKDGFPSNLLINVFKIGGKLRYTAEKGIFIYDSSTDSFIPDPELSPFFENDHVREMEEDLLGNIVFLTDSSLGVLKKDSFGEMRKEIKSFQKILSLISDDLENIIMIDPKNILFNAKSGFIHYDPSKSTRPRISYPTLIRSVERGGKSVFAGYYQRHSTDLQEAQQGLLWNEYDYGQTSIKFRFASTFFEGMEDTEYQYQLDGYEDDWSKWSVNTTKEYTNLLEGTYTFRVRARNIYGQLGEPASFTFKVYPPWYRSLYARILYVMIGVVAFGALWFWLDKRYREKQRSLEASTQQVLKQKDIEIRTVTEESEKTITQLKNEKLKVEIDAKDRELAASATHLIHKNEFLSYLKNTAKSLSKEAKNKDVSKQLNKMVKEIDRNVSEDQTWQLFELHFNQVHSDFTQKVKQQYPKLTPQELRLSAFLRMNMSTKEIAHLLNISVRGVEISRYRLRKKLGIAREVNLVEFMMEI